MTHFVLAFVVISNIFLVSKIEKNKNKIVLYVLPFLLLYIFAAIRYGYGNDYFNYLSMFVRAKNKVNIVGDERLFKLFLKVSPNFNFVIAFSSFVNIYPIYKLVRKYVAPEYVCVALFVYCFDPYFFLMSLSAIRQFMAASFFVIAVHFAYKRKWIWYVLIVIVMSMIHVSSLVLLPLYFIINDREISQLTFFVFVVASCILVLNSEWIRMIISSVLDFAEIQRYDIYQSQEIVGTYRTLIMTGVWVLYIGLNIHKLRGIYLVFAKLSLLSSLLYGLELSVALISRLQIYFVAFSVVTIPAIMKYNFENPSKGFWGLTSKYILPTLIFGMLLVRYVRFFCDPLWKSFTTYNTIFGGGL